MPWQYMDGQQVWIPEEGQPTAPGDWFGNFLSSFFRKDNKEQQPDSTVPAPFDPLRFYATGTNQDRINFLTNLGLTYGGGEAGTAVWVSPSGERIPESAIVQGIMEGSFKGVSPAKTTATGGSSVPAYVYAAQAELARAQAADIPVARAQREAEFIAAEQARKFGQGAQIIGLQTNNQDLANRGSQIVFEQSTAVANARNRIQELDIQQQNLRQQYEYNASAANAAAANEAARFNAQMGFNVEQANVAAQQRKQEQLQSLARDVSEAAKAPGDYGKLAALTLANTGWGQANTAIGRGEDLRTEQSLAPLESQLRTRKDVMAQPDRPFTFTPITPTFAQAPVVAPVDASKFAVPQQTITSADIERQRQAGAAAIAGLGGGAAPAGGNAGGSLQVVNGQPVFVSNSGQTFTTSGGEFTAAATGGVVPRYADGGVNDNGEFNPIAVYEMLRKGGSSEQQAADMINAIMRSDQALQANTAAAQAQQPQQPMDIEQVAQQMPPSMYRPASGAYYATEDAAPAAAGWAPQIPQSAQPAMQQMEWVPAKTLTPEEFRRQENERKNREMFESIFGGLMAYPGGGAGVRGAGVASDFLNALRLGKRPTSADANILRSLGLGNLPRPEMNPNILRSLGLGDVIEQAEGLKGLGLYATGGVANGAYISGERGPELNIPLGDKTIVLNQKQMKAAGIDLKKLMEGSKKPEQFAQGGVFDQGWGNVTDPDRTMAMNFLNDALAKARAGTPWQQGNLPSPVYASSPGFSPIVSQVLGSLTSMAQGVPTEYFQELAQRYRPAGTRESVTQRSA